MAERDNARRWLRNVGLYVVGTAGFALALGVVSAVSGGRNDAGGSMAGFLFFGYWLVVAALAALLPYLLILELVAHRARHRRRWVVVAGGVVPGAGLILSQIGHPFAITVESVEVLLAVAAAGAVYGAVVGLPPPAHQVTLRDAD